MKIKLGQVNPSFPMPVALVGALVDGKPNFLTVAWFTMMCYQPPTLGVVLGADHYTNTGIRENKVFSLCLPGEDLVRATDYVGIVSGQNTDKSKLFELFQGDTGAPLIVQCPICVECELVGVEKNQRGEMFIGRIVQVHADESVLADGRIDLGKVRPLLFSHADSSYYKLGAKYEKAWSIGKGYK
ncbi:flavin reductase family protein [bacterium]|nr:flavin reductase family protein [bacterium]